MAVTDEQLRLIEERIAHAVRAVGSEGGEPNELWLGIEERIEHRRRRPWFRVGLAIATVTAVLGAMSVRQLVDHRPATVSSASTAGAVETIGAVCQSLLSMRDDIVPLPDEAFDLRFTIRRMQATYSSAATAMDAIAAPQELREARSAWRSMFEMDARHRLDQAAIDIDVASTPTVEQLVGGSLAMMVAAVTELYDAGIGACNPQT